MSETSRRDRRAVAQFVREVRARIWAWDPIGLAEIGAPDDEYDCLVGPVTGALRERLSAADMADRLRLHVIDHFGVEPSGTEAFSDGIVTWFHASAASFQADVSTLTDGGAQFTFRACHRRPSQ